MKKLLLSTLILTTSFVHPLPLAKKAATATPSNPTAATAPTTIPSASDSSIDELFSNIQKGQGPIIDRLKTLETDIKKFSDEIKKTCLESLSKDAKNKLNDKLNQLDIEANDLWEKFGGSSLKWYFTKYQSADLQTIARHIANIKDLYNKVNPTSIITEPIYTAASWANKNRCATLAATWLALRVITKGCYNNGLYPSSETLKNIGSWIKWATIG